MRIRLPNARLERNIKAAVEMSINAPVSNFDDALTLALMGLGPSYEESLRMFVDSPDPLSAYLVAKHLLRNERAQEAIDRMRAIKLMVKKKCLSGELDELLCLRLRAFEHGYAFRRLSGLYGGADPLMLANAFVSYNHERHALRLLEGVSPTTPSEALLELTVFRRAIGLTAMRGSLIMGVEHLNYLDWLVMDGVGGGLVIQFNSIHRAYTISTIQVQAMESRLLLHGCEWEVNDGATVEATAKCDDSLLYFVGNPTDAVIEIELPGEGVVKTSTAEFRASGKLLVLPMDYASAVLRL
ncbi:hypothetical protein [Thermocladium modestius]|uniref:hypothetical protein n=1 Tax=Thermocladium modestius TaxID=62609 RepID=UPI001669D2D0|nr:hypothetical protein [Thermocladium modestius]